MSEFTVFAQLLFQNCTCIRKKVRTRLLKKRSLFVDANFAANSSKQQQLVGALSDLEINSCFRTAEGFSSADCHSGYAVFLVMESTVRQLKAAFVQLCEWFVCYAHGDAGWLYRAGLHHKNHSAEFHQPEDTVLQD